MHIAIPHKGTQPEAALRIRKVLDDARPKLQEKMQIAEERWDDDTLHFDVTTEGQHITGTLAVAESDYVIDAKLPLMMRLFEGKIEQMLGEQIKQLG